MATLLASWTERRVLIDRNDFNPKNFQKVIKFRNNLFL